MPISLFASIRAYQNSIRTDAASLCQNCGFQTPTAALRCLIYIYIYIFVIYSLRWRDAEASAKVPLWIRRFVYLQPLLPSAETIWKVLRFVDQNKWSISYWAAPLAMLDFASIEEAVAGEKETERALAGNFPFPNSQWWKCKYSKSKTTGESVKWWIQFVGA